MRTQEKIKQTCKIAEQMHFLKLQFQGYKIFLLVRIFITMVDTCIYSESFWVF